MTSITIVLLASALSGSNLSHATHQIFAASQRLEEISFRDYQTTNKRVRLLVSYYATSIQPWQAQLEHLNADSIELLFKSANLTEYYSDDVEYVNDMEQDLVALAKAGEVPAKDYKDLYGALLQTRQFAKARVFRKKHPQLHLEQVPEIQGVRDEGTSALVVDDAGRSATWKHFPVDGSQVVIVSHPSCHFTANAVRYIESHVKLSKYLAGSIWIAPPTRALDVRIISQWNKLHPNSAIALASAQSDWPMISSWETPAFYFFRQGKLVRTVIGWPERGNASAIEAGLQEVGLAPSNASVSGDVDE